MEIFAVLASWMPYLIGMIINGVLAGICFYGWSETRLRGWRLMAIASVIRVVDVLPRLYAQTLIRSAGPADFGRWMRNLAVVDLAITPITALLTIGGLLLLLDDVRRLLRRT
ncbi:MAG TPA: hypothetical protein VFF06_28615 [Polyangia bacterium]|nr:hypothetical protein [Polyangia bacterium]